MRQLDTRFDGITFSRKKKQTHTRIHIMVKSILLPRFTQNPKRKAHRDPGLYCTATVIIIRETRETCIIKRYNGVA